MGMLQTSSQCQIGILSGQIQYLCHYIFKITGLHAGGTHAADLFLVSQQAYCRVSRFVRMQLCQERRKPTDSVILPITHNHTAIQTKISCLTCRNGLQLSREKIFFFHVVFFFEILQQRLFDEFLFLFILFFRIFPRTTSNDDVKVLTFYHNSRFLLHLLTGQMNQKIRNTKNRILCLLADSKFNDCSIFFYYHAMQCQRNRCPLVLFDAAVIMSIQKCHLSILIQRILFQIQTRGINMGTQDIHTLLHGNRTDLEQYHQFFLVYRINLITRNEIFTTSHSLFQRNVSILTCHLHRNTGTFTLRFSFRNKSAVLLCYLSQFLQRFLIIGIPCVFTFHIFSLQIFQIFF